MSPEEDISLHRPLEEALANLVRLFKAVAYYPAAHPSLHSALEETRRSFFPAFSGASPLILSVRRDGFLHGESPLPPHPLLSGLAAALFARQVQSLTILPELAGDDLLAFSRAIAQDPGELLKQGGLAQVLQASDVRTIWVNQTDLARILERRAELVPPEEEEDVGEEGSPSETALLPGGEEGAETLPWGGTPLEGEPSEEDLVLLLGHLRSEESDAKYRTLLLEIVRILGARLSQEFRYPVLETLEFLLAQSRSQEITSRRRNDSLAALEQLGTDDLMQFLIDFLCDPMTEDDLRRGISRVLFFYRDHAARPLMGRLADESSAQARRALMEVLVSLGDSAISAARGHLRDGRWFVVRNAAVVLGELRRPETIDAFPPLLSHPDLRVRREAVRSLTRIAGPEAVSILLRVVEGEDPELSRQALLSLGALRDSSAVPTLLRLAAESDPLGRRADIRKGAIRALGEIGSADAVPLLERLVRTRSLWRRASTDEIRAVAASALGEIGGGTAVLERAVDDRSPEVARAALLALKSLRKGQHEPGAQ